MKNKFSIFYYLKIGISLLPSLLQILKKGSLKVKCVFFFNVDYRLGSKKSKFDMTLIRQSPFKLVKFLFPS